jgi:hypothetical protein
MKIYHDKVNDHLATIHRLDKLLKDLSLQRVIVFVLSAIIIVVLVNQRSPATSDSQERR